MSPVLPAFVLLIRAAELEGFDNINLIRASSLVAARPGMIFERSFVAR